MFSLVSNRYERASMIVTSNKPFCAWGEIFGDDMAATAMIDRLIHHAEILSPQRRQLPAPRQRPRRPPQHAPPTSPDPHRDRAAGISLRSPTARSAKRRRQPHPRGLLFNRRNWSTFQPALTGPGDRQAAGIWRTRPDPAPARRGRHDPSEAGTPPPCASRTPISGHIGDTFQIWHTSSRNRKPR